MIVKSWLEKEENEEKQQKNTKVVPKSGSPYSSKRKNDSDEEDIDQERESMREVLKESMDVL